MNATAASDVDAGEVLLSAESVSLSFGGVTALRDVSLDIRKGEVRAIIGPNGAGKTSMLNVINGFYTPQAGRITFKGETRSKMRPFEAARGGIARTFQNVALFRGMTALDNIMAGRTLKMHRGLFWQLLRFGPALAEEVENLIDPALCLEVAPLVQMGNCAHGAERSLASTLADAAAKAYVGQRRCVAG